MAMSLSGQSFIEREPPTRTSSIDFIQTKLRRLHVGGLDRSNSSVEKENFKGPLGLTLLHAPAEPQIDFIFVHGLGGGSRKTWSFSQEAGMFWPKDWLANEAGFKHVRTHSYGYNSDWTAKKGSSLTIHDFGQALLADIHNCPALRKNGETPIVFVAHSMGGLVVKKAYLLATRDPAYQTTARRIHSIYFLGTPHRGADLAQVIKLARQSAGYGSKAFAEELMPGGGSLDQINDEFRHICGNLQLWSFFEGIPTSFGFTSSLVVDKESAVLGLPGEHVQYMEADHRQICKFESPVHPNYMILQRSFLTTIDGMDSDNSTQRREEYRSQMKLVSSFLKVAQGPEATLLALTQKQHQGSCRWVTSDYAFQRWADASTDSDVVDPLQAPPKEPSPRLLWLHGRPGTGKSVVSAHVIRYLDTCNFDCSFYFFGQGKDQGPTSVPGMLRSLAWQMAAASFEIRQVIVDMTEDDVRLGDDDHHMLWTKLFVERIFKIEMTKPHFWIIDALDECSSKTIPALVSMLSSLEGSTTMRLPLRVFMTSRPGGQLERLLLQEKTIYSELHTGDAGSLKDIELFLAARCPQDVPANTSQDLMAEVLAKSNGIFLWASLTVAKLEDTYSIEDMKQIIQEIPSEMDEFYSRIIATIAASPSAELARCILKWVICSPRPLSVAELAEAVRLDIDRTLTASSSQLQTITGHLVFVDKLSFVHVTHQTTSAFLTKKKGEFWVDRASSHSRIAEICLQVLCGSAFSPPRSARKINETKDRVLPPLSDYAIANFSHHLKHGSASANAPLTHLSNFLRTNILTWIDLSVRSGSLSNIQTTALRLQAYLRRRAKYEPPLGSEIQTVTAWANDLQHIIAAYSYPLLNSPSSIYFLVPHLCPPNSIIRKQFVKQTKRLKIAGPMEEDWTDRLTSYLFLEDASSIACSDRQLAIGLTNGEIKIYNNEGPNIYDCRGSLPHGRRVRQLAFNQAHTLLAACSARRIEVFDVKTLRSFWSRPLDFAASDLRFHADGQSLIIANPQSSSIITLHDASSPLDELRVIAEDSDASSSDTSSSHDGHQHDDEDFELYTPADRIRLDPHHKLAGLSYRNAAVTIWDIDATESIGIFERDGFEDVYSSPQVLDMLFNPISELELLAITYKDGDTVTCNPWTLEQTAKHQMQISLISLAATSDGRILAGADEEGAIFLFLFETLSLIYTIERPDEQLRVAGLLFSHDNLRLFDIRGQSCNVWEPAALIPRDSSDDASSSEPQSEEWIIPDAETARAHCFRWGEAITVMAHSGDGACVFAGTQHGLIVVSDASTGNTIEEIRMHDAFVEIRFLEWHDKAKILLSVDTVGRCIAVKGSGKLKSGWKRCLDHREQDTIHQALVCPDGAHILLQTETSVKILAMDGTCKAEMLNSNGVLQWMCHPTEEHLLLGFQADRVHFFECQTLNRASQEAGILVSGANTPVVANANPGQWVNRPESNFAFSMSKDSGPLQELLAIDMTKIETQTTAIESHKIPLGSQRIRTFIGMLKSTLYYLSTTGWVCSVSLKASKDAGSHYTRHFFVPPTWYTGGDVVMRILSKTAVAFARGEQIMVFHGFLEFEEKMAFFAGDIGKGSTSIRR